MLCLSLFCYIDLIADFVYFIDVPEIDDIDIVDTHKINSISNTEVIKGIGSLPSFRYETGVDDYGRAAGIAA